VTTTSHCYECTELRRPRISGLLAIYKGDEAVTRSQNSLQITKQKLCRPVCSNKVVSGRVCSDDISKQFGGGNGVALLKYSRAEVTCYANCSGGICVAGLFPYLF